MPSYVKVNQHPKGEDFYTCLQTTLARFDDDAMAHMFFDL
jgi:hypothetical protein